MRAIRVDRSKFRNNNRPWTPNAVNEQSALFIPEPHRKWIIVKARPEDLASITDWIKKLDKPMLTVTAEDTLDKIENKKDVVQRFIKLKHASVDRMVAIITPMLGDMARVTPEPTTGTLMVVDSVENLLRIEKIVAQFDVPQRDDTITQVFELQFREPEEIANLLGAVVGDNSLSTASTSQTGQYRQNWEWAGRAMRLSRFRSGAPNRRAEQPRRRGQQRAAHALYPGAASQVDHRQGPPGRHGADRRLDQAAGQGHADGHRRTVADGDPEQEPGRPAFHQAGALRSGAR